MAPSLPSPKAPDMLVAIDMGTECTKAACAVFKSDGTILEKGEIEWNNGDSTIMTCLTKHATHNTFGRDALAELDRPGTTTYRWFKLGMGPDRPVEQDLCTLFLGHVLRQLAAVCGSELIRLRRIGWEQARVEFVFSVPFANGEGYSQSLHAAARAAGYEGIPGHRIRAEVMHESKAAAMYALGHLGPEDVTGYLAGQSVLVADIGGGTTDVCVFRVDDPINRTVTPLGSKAITGELLGSVGINQGFAEMLEDYLRQSGVPLPSGRSSFAAAARSVAWSVEFDSAKARAGSVETVGGELEETHESFRFDDFPDLPKKNGFGIEGGSLKVSSPVILGLFDKQIHGKCATNDRGIKGVLDGVIEATFSQGRQAAAASTAPHKSRGFEAWDFEVADYDGCQIDNLVWTGGLGGSSYLRRVLQTDLGRDAKPPSNDPGDVPQHRNLVNVRHRVVDKPQLCVALGMLDAQLEIIEQELKPAPMKKKLDWLKWPKMRVPNNW